MFTRSLLRFANVLIVALVAGHFGSASIAAAMTHPPMRPLPTASKRPLSAGPTYFVDAAKGDDQNSGSKEKPWRTIRHALQRLRAGDTLCLRGGTYYEWIIFPRSGEAGKPITLRSFPGEIVVIDGGLREFFEEPATAWTPLPDGAEHEYVSTRTYPEFLSRPILTAFPAAGWEPFYGKEDERPLVLGHFGDSMVPLHGYRTLSDLRDSSMLWDVDNKFQKEEGVYCGPGLWYNRETQRIHIRLAPTQLEGLGELAYRGPTDPRQVPLCLSGPYGEDVLRINGVNHIVVQDLVFRGAGGSPLLNLYGADDITFDGITVFGGSPGLLAKATSHLKIIHSAFRGIAAPWSSRASMKYRGTPAYLLITQRNQPENHDWEIANCEFTDSHDGIWIRHVRNLKFHHNYLDNFNDDGLEFGARKRDQEIYVYQNFISRCLLTLTLHEMEPDESPAEVNPGSGVYITRNIFDLRRGTFKAPPKEPDPSGAYLNESCSLTGDHGGPTWPNYYFYHNTVIRTDAAWRGYYGFGIGGRGTRFTQRRVFNNIFVQLHEVPGLNFASSTDDVLVDGNLHWGLVDGPKFAGNFFETQGRAFAFRREPFPKSWMTKDLFADPKFEQLTVDPAGEFDLRLQADSPAANAGIAIPDEWFDPLREADQGAPDIGAIPLAQEAWSVGIHGRLDLSGRSPAAP